MEGKELWDILVKGFKGSQGKAGAEGDIGLEVSSPALYHLR